MLDADRDAVARPHILFSENRRDEPDDRRFAKWWQKKIRDRADRDQNDKKNYDEVVRSGEVQNDSADPTEVEMFVPEKRRRFECQKLVKNISDAENCRENRGHDAEPRESFRAIHHSPRRPDDFDCSHFAHFNFSARESKNTELSDCEIFGKIALVHKIYSIEKTFQFRRRRFRRIFFGELRRRFRSRGN